MPQFEITSPGAPGWKLEVDVSRADDSPCVAARVTNPRGRQYSYTERRSLGEAVETGLATLWVAARNGELLDPNDGRQVGTLRRKLAEAERAAEERGRRATYMREEIAQLRAEIAELRERLVGVHDGLDAVLSGVRAARDAAGARP